ncbi:hypothetical protein, partial [Proteus faecis]|uniref:hypothetical protein n=1 Tax=Proteus faecis TaxID=2050967 RepID=UPI003075B6B1
MNEKLQKNKIPTIDFDAENVNENINNVTFLKAIDSVFYATVGNRFDNMIASCATFLQTFTKGCEHLPKICKLTQH